MKTFMFALVAATALAVLAANKPEREPDPDAAAVFDMRIDAAVRRETAKYVKALAGICKKAVKAKRLDKASEILDQIAVVDEKAAGKLRAKTRELAPIVGKWMIAGGAYWFKPTGAVMNADGKGGWTGKSGTWRKLGRGYEATVGGGTLSAHIDGDLMTGIYRWGGDGRAVVNTKRMK